MDGSYYVLVAGGWEPVPGVQRGVTKSMARPSAETISLGGVRRRQRAARAPRSWALTFSSKDPKVVSWLTLAAQGLIGDIHLLDVAAAQVNMLAPADTIGALTEPTLPVDGHTFAMLPHNHTFMIKCRAGIEYRLSASTNHAAGSTVATITAGDEDPITVAAPDGTGTRVVSAVFTPGTDADVVFTFTRPGVTGTSLLRLTEGSVDDHGFLPGQKAVCQVSVDDPAETLELLTTNQLPLSTYTVNLLEVGL